MGLRNWQRKTYQKRLGERVLDHNLAAARHRPTHLAGASVAALVASRVVAHLATHLLFLLVATYALAKIRSVVLTDHHVTVFRSSRVSGPVDMGTFPASALASGAGPARWRYTPLTLGDVRYWIRTGSFERMKAANVRWFAEALEERRLHGHPMTGRRPTCTTATSTPATGCGWLTGRSMRIRW